MPAEIKAKLILETGGGVPAVSAGAPAAGGMSAEQSGIFREMSHSFKSISRFLKRPSSMFGGGDMLGGGLIGQVTALLKNPTVLLAIGTAAAAIFAGVATKNAFQAISDLNETIRAWEARRQSIEQAGSTIGGGVTCEDLPSPTGTVAENIRFIDYAASGFKGTYEQWAQLQEEQKFVEEIEQIQARLNELKKDGIELSEAEEFLLLQQRTETIRHIAAQENLHDSRSAALDLEIEFVGLAKEYGEVLQQHRVNQILLNDSLDDTLEKQKKITQELKIQSLIKVRSGGGGGDIYQATIGDQTYTGKINQGSLQGKFIGVRAVA